MPSTVNGIGTWYYGSKNVRERQDECEHCGAYANIKSYDTTKYFVFLYIPIIPLGRQHIVDMCGSCNKHFAVNLSEWNQQKDDAIREDVAAFQSDRYNVEKATALLKTCAGYYDKESFLKYAGEIESAISSDADALSLLASGYDYLGEARHAEETYRKSLRVKDDPGTRTTLGILLINQGRPAEARDYLWHLLSPLHANDVGVLYLLVEGYQSQGRHMDAKQVLDEMQRVFPELESDDTFNKYRKRVKKRLGSTKRVPPDLLKGDGTGVRFGTDWNGSTATAISIAALVAILAGLGFLFFSRTQRVDVYLVSGLDRDYSVRIGEETHNLRPNTPKEVTVPRRAGLVAQVVEPDWEETIEMPLPTDFWSSLFDDRTYVLNPDHIAVILWEQTEYAVNPVEKEMPYRIHLGKGFYAFDDLDYVFREFPETIELSSSSQVARRERITRYAGLAPVAAYAAALEFVTPDEGLDYLVHVLQANPDDVMALGAVAGLLPLEEFEQIAKPELEKRPLRMHWHRMYQTVIESAARNDELLETYRALLEAEPSNGDLRYLLARVTTDPAASERLLREATTGANPSAYGYHGLAYQKLSLGNFPAAHRLALRALELDPGNEIFAYVEDQALLALGSFDDLIEKNEAFFEQNPLNGETAAQLVRLHLAASSKARAEEVIQNYLQGLDPNDDGDVWRAYLQSVYDLGTGDWTSFRDNVGRVDEPRYRFQQALASGDYAEGIDALTAGGQQTAVDHLLVYLGADRAQERDLADAQLDAAVGILSQSSSEERALAQCLTGTKPASAALELVLESDVKATALAVLATRYGNRQARQLARTLNYNLGFQRYFLNRLGF